MSCPLKGIDSFKRSFQCVVRWTVDWYHSCKGYISTKLVVRAASRLGVESTMENMQAVNSFVAAYLKKKGFKEAEQLLEDLQKKESAPIDFHNDPDLAKFIHHFSQ
ncbi:hypothetical protein Goklo_022167 [Gossypium klotzschianum]|uniref:LisH domain-containing protein n=1 Tax=Gossypium klotzschianum TaxID=34286 RepID=A0A7J8TLX0_9ROSI|nr:hypothetical protein [Gossypium klotzschianum]